MILQPDGWDGAAEEKGIGLELRPIPGREEQGVGVTAQQVVGREHERERQPFEDDAAQPAPEIRRREREQAEHDDQEQALATHRYALAPHVRAQRGDVESRRCPAHPTGGEEPALHAPRLPRSAHAYDLVGEDAARTRVDVSGRRCGNRWAQLACAGNAGRCQRRASRHDRRERCRPSGAWFCGPTMRCGRRAVPRVSSGRGSSGRRSSCRAGGSAPSSSEAAPLPVEGSGSGRHSRSCGAPTRQLSSRPDRYIHGGRNFFLRRARAPHWELRVDVSPDKRVTQIAFGERASVRLDEGCA